LFVASSHGDTGGNRHARTATDSIFMEHPLARKR
jgi:hypothetical protein